MKRLALGLAVAAAVFVGGTAAAQAIGEVGAVAAGAAVGGAAGRAVGGALGSALASTEKATKSANSTDVPALKIGAATAKESTAKEDKDKNKKEAGQAAKKPEVKASSTVHVGTTKPITAGGPAPVEPKYVPRPSPGTFQTGSASVAVGHAPTGSTAGSLPGSSAIPSSSKPAAVKTAVAPPPPAVPAVAPRVKPVEVKTHVAAKKEPVSNQTVAAPVKVLPAIAKTEPLKPPGKAEAAVKATPGKPEPAKPSAGKVAEPVRVQAEKTSVRPLVVGAAGVAAVAAGQSARPVQPVAKAETPAKISTPVIATTVTKGAETKSATKSAWALAQEEKRAKTKETPAKVATMKEEDLKPLDDAGLTAAVELPQELNFLAAASEGQLLFPQLPPPPEMTKAVLKTTAVGTSREDLLHNGTPASRVTMFEDGHVLEIYSYHSKGSRIGTVRLNDGAVSSVQISN